jgi:TrpR family trp operon transcriptional repressor
MLPLLMRFFPFKRSRSLVHLFASVQTEGEWEELLQDLFTPAEVATFTERIEIFHLLGQGIPHHEIAERLGCGVATVTRGSAVMRRGHAIVPKLLKRI